MGTMKDLIENIIEVKRTSPRIMGTGSVVGRKECCTVHSQCILPRWADKQEEKEALWGRLDDEVGKVTGNCWR